MATPVLCRACNQTHDPLLQCSPAAVRPAKGKSIVVRRDRAKWNAYMRDWRKKRTARLKELEEKAGE